MAGDFGLPPGFSDLAPCGLLLLDNNYEIVAANAYFQDLAGVTLDGSAPMLLHRLLSVGGRIFLQTKLQQQLALAQRVEELALDIVRPDGVRVPVMLNAVQETDAEGRPGPIRMAVWRAAAKRAYEAEVPKARQAAADAGRVKADFLANVSHELRTPLNGVVGVAAALGCTELNPRQAQMVALIQSSGAMLERLVSDILDMAKVQAGSVTLDRRPFDLLHELAGVIEVARLRAEEKGLRFELSAAPESDGRFVGDAVRIRQIVAALLSNAVKFTEAGEVRLRIGKDADGAIEIEVADTGVGFDEAQAAGLFQGFHQADTSATRKHGGAGLGLSIAKGLIDLMEGAIDVRSRPGDGSVFTVRLPLPSAVAASAAPARAARAEAVG